jgi:hypothetical protein
MPKIVPGGTIKPKGDSPMTEERETADRVTTTSLAVIIIDL